MRAETIAAARPAFPWRRYAERAVLACSILLATGTIGARVSDCTLSVPAVTNERFDPGLTRITNVDQAMALAWSPHASEAVAGATLLVRNDLSRTRESRSR